jgi:flagellar biosynthesis protein FlhF
VKQIVFTAQDANAALTQIQEQLGPEAVVMSVRQMPASRLARLWQKNRWIEVTAGVPQTPAETRRQPVPETRIAESGYTMLGLPNRQALEKPAYGMAASRWRTISWLESKGLLPTFLDKLEEKIHILYGRTPGLSPEKEWSAVTDLMTCHWRPTKPPQTATGRPHVFIGPAGSGKTTVLCKWMASGVLLNEYSARVWRMDGESANTSELLTLHCESMGVPLERSWADGIAADDLRFVDLPGVETNNHHGISILKEQIERLPQPHIHLVLNAAYDTAVLFEQFEAFSSCQPEDIIFTHLDEERRRVKLWNFVFGTNCPISYLSTGQKIPGRLERAEPALLFPQKNHQ